MRQHALVQAGDVIRAQTRDCQSGESDIGQCLVLHAGEILRFGPARPRRLGDDADMLVRMAFDEGVLAGKDAAGIAAEVDHVGHRHVVGVVSQGGEQCEQPIARNYNQNGLPLL